MATRVQEYSARVIAPRQSLIEHERLPLAPVASQRQCEIGFAGQSQRCPSCGCVDFRDSF